MRIAFRCDASYVIGSGHVMRCLVLADQLVERGAECRFLCVALPGELSAFIRQRGFMVYLLPSIADEVDDARQSTAILSEWQPDWLVLDHYQLGRPWQLFLRPAIGRLMVIDDLANRAHDADLLLDQNFAPAPDRRYDELLPSACLRLLGPRYSLLSPAFARLRMQRRLPTIVPRILISFGGSDPANLTLPVLQALLAADLGDVAFDVVIGGQCRQRFAIETCASRDARVCCHVATQRMAEIMADASIFVGAGGATSWERCCLGMASVIVAVSDNQDGVSQVLADAGLQLYLGRAEQVGISAYVSAVALLLRAPTLASHIGRRAADLVDGDGASRVSRAMLASDISLRPVTLEDGIDLHRWRNHVDVRRFSGDGRQISLENHMQWLRSVVNDPGRRLFIGSDSTGPVGVLRYDLVGDTATVSIYLTPERFGQGLGGLLLTAGERWLSHYLPQVRQVRAVIYPDNYASVRMFESTGFRPAEQYYIKYLGSGI